MDGAGAGAAQELGNLASSPISTKYPLCDLSQVAWSYCPSSPPFMKWQLRVTKYPSGFVGEK